MLPMIQGLGVSQQALFVVCRTNRACFLTKKRDWKRLQTLVFSRLVAISDMSFVIFARANVF